MSRNEKRTSANSVKFTFIAKFFLSPGSYALDAWLASNPACVAIWAGVEIQKQFILAKQQQLNLNEF